MHRSSEPVASQLLFNFMFIKYNATPASLMLRKLFQRSTDKYAAGEYVICVQF